MASKANIDVKSNALSRTTKACLQCRSMKSKCDGHSPCGRCLRRNTDCKYEEILRRRGPDRKPRAHAQKLGRPPKLSNNPIVKSTKRRNLTILPLSINSSRLSIQPCKSLNSSSLSSTTSDFSNQSHFTSNVNLSIPNLIDDDNLFGFKFNPTSTFNENFYFDHLNPQPSQLLLTPNLQYHQETYWDVLITDKMSEMRFNDRNQAIRELSKDLWVVFSRGDFIATLFHLHTFFENVMSNRKRNSIEPSLIYSLLAISYALQGRFDLPDSVQLKLKANRMADMAHDGLTMAMVTGKLTLGIAQAGVVLQYYELFPTISFNVNRIVSAFLVADTVIRKQAFTCLDVERSVSNVYDDDAVPIQINEQPVQLTPMTPKSIEDVEEIHTKSSCPCLNFSEQSSEQKKSGIRYRFIPKFTINDSPEAIYYEEIRRVVFGALNQSWYQQMFDPTSNKQAFKEPFHVTDSSNYGIYLTAENYVLSLPDEEIRSWSNRTLFALLDRVKLLCHGAMRLCKQLPPLELHLRSIKICQEVEYIESELHNHSCNHGIPLWQIQNAAFITRMILTAKSRQNPVLTKFKPCSFFTRQRAKEWMEAHTYIYTQFISGGIKDAPMIFGILSVQALRCINLYQLDHALIRALYISQRILSAIERLLQYHPCDCTDAQLMLDKIKKGSDYDLNQLFAFKPDIPPPIHPDTLLHYLTNDN